MRTSHTIWYDDWDAGLATARSQGKPVLVDFRADNCSWCDKLEAETFSAPKIASRLSAGWICIIVDVSHRDPKAIYDHRIFSYQELAEYFNVRGYPTLVFLDRETRPVTTLRGFYDAAELVPYLDYLKIELYLENISFDEYIQQQ